MGSSMKEYLQKYMGSGDTGGDLKLRKKKLKRNGKKGGSLASRGRSNSGSGVIIVDDDALWQKDLKPEDEDEAEEDGDAPLVIEDVEVKRMQRMEAMKMHRPYLSVANDGSGWVTVKGDEPEVDAGDSRIENAVKGLASRLPLENRTDALEAKRRRDSPDLSPPRRRDASGEASGDHIHDRKRRFPMEGSSNDAEDLSPPRYGRDSAAGSPSRKSRGSSERRRAGTPPQISQRRRHDSPSLSPPRRNGRHDSPGLSPPRKRRHDSPSPPPSTRRRLSPSDDLSPLRRKHDSSVRKNGSDDFYPPRRAPNADPADLSPPRRRRNSPPRSAGQADLSPPRRLRQSPPRHAGAADLSPPRRRRDSPPKRAGHADLSPPRRGRGSPARNAGPVDLSPPRRRRDSPSRRSSAADVLLPPRRSRVSSDSGGAKELASSLPLGGSRRRHDSPETSARELADSSKSAMDSSPPRKSATREQSGQASPPRGKGTSRMADGTIGGLKSVQDVASDVKRIRATEAKLLSELDPSLSGRGAETVFRDKRGRRLEGLEEMLRQQKGGGKPAEQPLEWGKGLAQKNEASAALAELEAEKSKPFARYRDDVDLDKSLREAVRFGDPMAHLVKKKGGEEVLEDLGARDEMKASGFIVPQDIPRHSWLKTGAIAPPNRFEIRPGRHWDGVDRSTGFDRDLFKHKNEKKAREQEAYLWSVADM